MSGYSVAMKNKLLVSVMAGISCAQVAGQTQAERIVRAIPNAAAIGKSFTPWFATAQVRESDWQLVQSFFTAIGQAMRVPQESHIEYCVGLTSSGAAFNALLAEAMIAHTVAQGFSRDFAAMAARGVVCGASQLFAGAESDTSAIVKEMIDYRGTSAAALQTMLVRGFNDVVAAWLAAAAKGTR